MKLVSGIVGLVIFAVSLPSASQVSQDVARVAFYDKVFPNQTCPYNNKPINETQKAAIIIKLESGLIKFSNNQYDYVDPTNSAGVIGQIRSATSTLCTTQATLSQQELNAQNELNGQLSTAVTAYNAANKPGAAGTGRPGTAPAAGGNGMAGSAAALEAIKIMKDEDKGKGGKDAKSDRGRSSGEASSGDGKAATGGTAATTGNAAGPNPSATSGAAGAPVATGIQGLINQADGLYKGTIPGKIISTPGGASLNTATRTVSLPGTNEGEMIHYNYNKATGKFVSTDGTSSISPENLADAMETCTGECSTTLKEFAADPKTAADAKEIASAGNTVSDAAGQSVAQSATAAGQSFHKTIMTQSQGLNGTVCALGRTPIVTTAETYGTQLGSCGNWGGKADTFCSTIRSPKAKTVQRFMTLGTMIIGRTSSASEGCSAAQKFATVAQQGMTVANLACTGLMYSCEFTCGSAQTNLLAVGAALKTQYGACVLKLKAELATASMSCVAGCAAVAKVKAEMVTVETTYNALNATYEAELKLPTAPSKYIAKCAEHEADALDMAVQIIGAMDAHKQAKACRRSLGDGNGGGGGTGGTDVSMEQFCKVPGQALIPPCKCRTEPTAAGCPGHLATTLNNETNYAKPTGGGATTTNTGGVAGLATPGGLNGYQNGLKKPGSALSKEAKAALGVSDSSMAATDGSNSASGYAGGSSDSNGGSDTMNGSAKLGSGLSADAAKKLAADKKHNFGDFDMSGVSFGNLKFGADGKAVINGKKYSQEEIKVMAARKIASEEFFQQVTTASGKSNWDKVRARYDENRGSLYAP